MINRFIEGFNNLKFKRKLLLLNLLIGLIPILLLGTFAIYHTHVLLKEREMTTLSHTLSKEVDALDRKLSATLDALMLITWNDSIRFTLSNPPTTNYGMYVAYRDILTPVFNNILTINKTIDSITIYTDSYLHPHGDSLKPLSDITYEPWFELVNENTSSIFYYDSITHDLLLVSQIYYQHPSYQNIVCLKLDTNRLFNSFTTLFTSPYKLSLLDDSKGHLPLYMINTNDMDTTYFSDQQTLQTVPWTLVLERPTSLVAQSTNGVILVILLVIALCLFLISITGFFLSSAVVSPLESLVKDIENVESGNFILSPTKPSKDEIGDLLKAFERMTYKLQHLIDEILKSKIKQQEFEMKALQAQINPHFLYNSFSLINSKAIVAGQDAISQMAQLLSTFYRTTLNKGNNMTTLNDELTNTLAYANIQRMMHSQSFDIIYEVDEATLVYQLPNLLIQPLVENAILHGLDHKTTPGKGILTILISKKETHLIIKVMDNGKGMSPEQCETILSTTSRGYGVQNVHQRIRLHYGDDFGLKYTSTINHGTCATMTLRI